MERAICPFLLTSDKITETGEKLLYSHWMKILSLPKILVLIIQYLFLCKIELFIHKPEYK